jgi:hypothetical protein
MRNIFRTAILACLFLTGIAHAQPHPTSAQQQIQPLLDEMMLAANVHDTDRFLTVYLHDPSLLFVFNGTVIHGWKDLRDQQLKWWNNGKSDVVYSLRGAPEFTVLCPNLVVTTQPMASHRTLPDGSVHGSDVVVTSVWKALPEGWRIVVVHESTVH